MRGTAETSEEALRQGFACLPRQTARRARRAAPTPRSAAGQSLPSCLQRSARKTTPEAGCKEPRGRSDAAGAFGNAGAEPHAHGGRAPEARSPRIPGATRPAREQSTQQNACAIGPRPPSSLRSSRAASRCWAPCRAAPAPALGSSAARKPAVTQIPHFSPFYTIKSRVAGGTQVNGEQQNAPPGPERRVEGDREPGACNGVRWAVPHPGMGTCARRQRHPPQPSGFAVLQEPTPVT